HPQVTLVTILLLLSGIVSKLSLLIICCMQKTTGSRLLALDLRNDVATSLVALGGAYLGDKFWPYADPIGAILVCFFIAISWFANVFSTIPLIVGRRAEQEQTARICRIAIAHDKRIMFLDHVMVYHLGERALVELHVVLDETLPLKVTHDICEALERKIRTLDFVDRVFLHVDYQLDGDR
uniref:ZT_dimer domain-containing protein n=1 Tax=Globodera pallida TaxID=36090 RepID=A0A183CQK8_GLOPA